jgi:hypothetical protein
LISITYWRRVLRSITKARPYALVRGCHHSDHHHRHPLGKSRLQHRELHARPLRTGGHLAGGGARTRGHRHRSFGGIGNLIWLLLAGWWLALGHIITAIGLAITIIGIPFAWAHLKFVPISLWPIGKTIVTSEEAEALRAGRPV